MFRPLTGGLLVALVLLLNALAAAPQLHERFHADAGHEGHQCAVTLFAHGQMDASVVVTMAAVPSCPVEVIPQPSVPVFSIAAETLPPGRAPPVAWSHS